MIVVGAAGELGLFAASSLTNTIGLFGIPVAGGPTVFDLLTRRATFVVGVAEGDPGEYITRGPEFDQWIRSEFSKYPISTGGVDAVLGLAVAEPPRTVPSKSPDGPYTRLPLIVLDVNGTVGGTVVGQVKYLTLKVRAKWADANDCRAVVSAKLLRGEEGTIRKGSWVHVGEANWYSEQKIATLFSPTVGPAATQSLTELRLLAQRPELLLERFLSNPRTSIVRGECVYLPLVYMREGSKFLFFNGGRPATALARVTSETGPIELEAEVRIVGQQADERVIYVRVKADWNELSISTFEPTRRDLQ